jgi:hypothetical protein
MLALRNAEITLFATDAYNPGTDTNDVTDTEQYSINIDLNGKGGIKLQTRFVEISGTSETDSLLIRVYNALDNSWEDIEVDVKEHDCGTAASEIIKTINIDTEVYGPGHCRLGVLASGGTNPFDVKITGKYY